MFERVLVGIDGSRQSEAALAAAKDAAGITDGEVRVVHVREIARPARGGVASLETHDEAGEIVDEAVAKLRADGVNASGVLRSALAGHVAVQILEEAKDWNASVIVLANRGLSDLAGLVLGSTTHKVLHLGHLPVLVVR